MKKNKLILIFIFLSIISLFGINDKIYAQENSKLYMIIFANTDAEDIGKCCMVDYNNMIKEAEKISNYTGLTLIKKYYYGSDFTKNNLIETIDNLECTINDIVFFYFTGHGFRYKNMDNDPLPILSVPDYQYKIDMKYIKEKIESKNPRLSIIIADCCNQEVNITKTEELATVEVIKENYKNLFLRTKGSVVATSSKAGKSGESYEGFSYCNPRIGGIFTYCFLLSLHQLTESNYNKKATWEDLMNNTKNQISNLKIYTNTQIPYYNINVEYTSDMIEDFSIKLKK